MVVLIYLVILTQYNTVFDSQATFTIVGGPATKFKWRYWKAQNTAPLAEAINHVYIYFFFLI